MAGSESPTHFIVPNSRQSHRGYTPALSTIRIPAKLAGSYLRREISGYRFGRARKNAFAWLFWGSREFIDDGVAHIQNGILHPQLSQIRDDSSSLGRG